MGAWRGSWGGDQRPVCSVGAYGARRPKAQKALRSLRVREGPGLPGVHSGGPCPTRPPCPLVQAPRLHAPRCVSLGRHPDGGGLDFYRFGNKRPQTPCLTVTHVSCLISGCRKSRGGQGVCVPSRGSSRSLSAGLLQGKPPAYAGPWFCFADPCACPHMSSDSSPPGPLPQQCGHMC